MLHKAQTKRCSGGHRDDPDKSMGKPEQLRHNLSDFWSKRISQKDRLIYNFDDNSMYIFAIGGHYEDY
ncbi:type II toxin-antitoxin system YoeB family toxin [Amphritea sp. 1_MG-2023]|uniref:type II toxin-antitoxin system YoeB family toxin n=1 Tax=Amphritea sp. 1_MG-2023 TaxID=3062670 RepID=UPI0026E252C1|nr:type II toxin-antitoxin system YoeB family toxin [Amphritea sp. 1_MG-2023]MDO6563823.1 type II toxin-antitoxin system YoeB family toxin [Amphritea sp. 1_MG-2023]